MIMLVKMIFILKLQQEVKHQIKIISLIIYLAPIINKKIRTKIHNSQILI
jgi:hypothetical protein